MRKSCVILAALSISTGLQAQSPQQDIEPIETFNAPLTGRFIDVVGFEQAACVLAIQDKRQIAATGDLVQARGLPLGTDYGIFRKHQQYHDPHTGESQGVYLDEIGQATLVSRDGEYSLLRVDYAAREVRLGDRLLPGGRRSLLAGHQAHAESSR